MIDEERKKRLKESEIVNSDGDDVVIREPVDSNKGKIGVEIKDLHKIYTRGNNYALKGLTLNFYENEITSFLGQVSFVSA